MIFEDATASVSIFSSGYSNGRLPIKYWFWVLLTTTISIPASIRVVDQKPSKYTVECLTEMKATHEEWVAQRLHNGNNSQEAFYTELQKIFQESQFDMIFLEQNFCTPFQDCFFESVEMGYAKIRDLLNSDCALSISSHIKKDLYSFTQLIEYTITGVAMGCFSNGAGYAIPRYHKQDEEAIRENMEQIRQIYVKYRFDKVLREPRSD